MTLTAELRRTHIYSLGHHVQAFFIFQYQPNGSHGCFKAPICTRHTKSCQNRSNPFHLLSPHFSSYL